MSYFILGGTGFIGNFLVKHLLDQGEEVTALVRDDSRIKTRSPGLKLIKGDPLKPGQWQKAVPDHQTIINLVGSPIMASWTDQAKEKIFASRVDSSLNVVSALQDAEHKTFICANAVGFYGPRGDEIINDHVGPGSGFLSTVAVKWQEAALGAENFGHRVVITRFPAVLGPGGGALAQMIPVFRFGLGGRLGTGSQWFPWVHILDLARAMQFLSQYKEIRGPVNLCAPKPVTNAQFTRALGKALNRPAFFIVPGFGLRLIYGEVADMLLSGQRCVPKVLHDAGFNFRFEDIDSALADIMARLAQK
ncbi:TIGR01777 family oxidoreductase [Desulfonatronovibrio hydrogenovorans]|uniref:TIGR01777 family oxidoreductase n=1 Tax=Desulfonatronovibrio hydrogenovorans TaxID=53245 RepID=UPI00048BEBA2|nr:TIGR01777 family oxidoreductase [Desulfonatronovibrio hydrogenovorans]